jgi:hypothetical protein
MIIYSFDPAVKNLGFVCMSVNTNWRAEVSELLDELNYFYANIPAEKSKTLKSMSKLIKSADEIINGIFTIEYMNIFNIAGDAPTVRQLKYLLTCLENQLPKPDVVLIEYQMNVNDKSRAISQYIETHFTPVEEQPIIWAFNAYPLKGASPKEKERGKTPFEPLEKEEKERGKIPFEPLEKEEKERGKTPFEPIEKEEKEKEKEKEKERNKEEKETKVQVVRVNPNIKNMYSVDTTEAGQYTSFISKYNSNYTANKKHTTYNFLYFIESRGLSDKIADAKNKLDDIADAFMQAYGWCKKMNIWQ